MNQSNIGAVIGPADGGVERRVQHLLRERVHRGGHRPGRRLRAGGPGDDEPERQRQERAVRRSSPESLSDLS